MATVRELLRLRPALVVRAGGAALDREIRWPHVSEESLAQLNFPTAH